jgi:hypothetical protein
MSKTSKTSKTSEMSKISKTSKTSKTSKMSKTGKTSKTSETSKTSNYLHCPLYKHLCSLLQHTDDIEEIFDICIQHFDISIGRALA